jgi:D-alanine-D-alanine ligase
MVVESTGAGNLDVVLLLDDARGLHGKDGSETFLFVSEAVVAIEAALARLGHRSRQLSFDMGVPRLVARLDAQRPDVVFQLGQPIPTDPESEWSVTGLLDLLGLAHTSESAETLVLACDKARAKALFEHHAIPSPAYAVSKQGELPGELPPAPWLAKPSREDGSLGIPSGPPASTREQLGERVRRLYQQFRQPILIETFVGGREFQVGIVGSELLPIVEIDFSGLAEGQPRLAGYESKWKYESTEFKGLHYACPAKLDADLQERVMGLARKTATAFLLKRYARLDLRMDERGEVYVLDVNPNPDLSPIATMHAMVDKAGWGFDGMVQRLLDLSRAALRGGEH